MFTLAVLLLAGASSSANASPFTMLSPTPAGALPSGVTEVGGIVIDIVGTNGARVVTQLSATSLFNGFSDTGTPIVYRGNPVTIGVQGGFTPAITGALGGGIADLSIRITLEDGDTSFGDFDFNDNSLIVNGQNVGNFSLIPTERTSPSGLTVIGTYTGFPDSYLATGFFHVTNAALLAAIYNSVVTNQQFTIQLQDVDPTDNAYNFTAGVSGGLVDVGQPPTVTGAEVPEPASIALWTIMGAASLAGWRRRKLASVA
ncbi:MAG TPA: hypothetical protein VL096_05285 [Pirellulaceae bacterium]|nr:hypothetical protein [Pirellulaceae bacterium]